MSGRLYDRPEVCRTYFFPQPGWPLPVTDEAAPVALQLPDGTPIDGYWSRCSGQRGAPTLLYLHGNGETIADQLNHWPDWARGAGADIFFVDYPGYAGSGGEPTFTGCCQAARAALEHLVEQGARVVVAGRSAGSIFALDVAAARPGRCAGLLLESGVADLAQRLDIRWPAIAAASRGELDRAALEAEMRRDFDHRVKLGRLRCPVLVLHTRHDGLIPCAHGEQLAAWAGDHLLELQIFEEGDHNAIQLFNEAAYRQALARLVAASRE